MTSAGCRHRGFSLIEISIALAVIAVLSAIAWPTYRTYERNSKDQVAKAALESLEPEIMRVVSNNNDVVPVNIAEMLDVGNLIMVDGDGGSTSLDIMSIAPLNGDGASAAVTVRSDSGACWIMLSTADTEPLWGVDRDAGGDVCRASNEHVTNLTVDGTKQEPSILDL